MKVIFCVLTLKPTEFRNRVLSFFRKINAILRFNFVTLAGGGGGGSESHILCINPEAYPMARLRRNKITFVFIDYETCFYQIIPDNVRCDVCSGKGDASINPIIDVQDGLIPGAPPFFDKRSENFREYVAGYV